MNLSIYIKLWIANTFGKVRIRPKYKHLNYMHENNFIFPINNRWVEVNGFPLPAHSNWYTITSDGKKAMWDKGNLLVTRLISVLALIVSIAALVINYYTK